MQDQEAENLLIGALLFDPKAVAEVRDIVRPSDMTQDIASKTLAAIYALDDVRADIDYLTVAEKIMQMGERAERHIIVARLVDYTNATFTSAMASSHAKMVRRKARLRGLQQVLQEQLEATVDAHFGSEKDAIEFFTRVAQKVGDVTNFTSNKTITSKELAIGTLKFAEERYQNKGTLLGPAIGMERIDNLLLGIRRKKYYVIGAQTSVGKTAFALQITRKLGAAGWKGLVLSYEMGTDELGLRVMSAESRVQLTRMELGNLEGPDFARMARASSSISSYGVEWADTPPSTVHEVRAMAQAMKHQQGLDFIVVDYLQLMSGDEKQREQEVAAISRGLKRMSDELNIAVFALSQLNRKADPYEEPSSAMLRESGAIEQDANVIILLWNEDEDDDTSIGIKVAKNRGGLRGKTTEKFNKAIQNFETLGLATRP